MSVKSGLGTDPVVGITGGSAKKRKEYKLCDRLQEGKRPVYAVCFNFIDSRFYNVFATAGGNRVTIYQLLENSGIAVLQTYVDEDKDEAFYTVSWAYDDAKSPLLIASGSNGVIRVINAGKEKLYKSFVGHGDSINELRTQGLRPCLVASASKIFTANVHSNYVDCTRWFGDLILSKSVDNEIVLWEALMKENAGSNDGSVDVLQKYPVPDCDIWFIKFSCDFYFNSLAIVQGQNQTRQCHFYPQCFGPVLKSALHKLSFPMHVVDMPRKLKQHF